MHRVAFVSVLEWILRALHIRVKLGVGRTCVKVQITLALSILMIFAPADWEEYR